MFGACVGAMQVTVVGRRGHGRPWPGWVGGWAHLESWVADGGVASVGECVVVRLSGKRRRVSSFTCGLNHFSSSQPRASWTYRFHVTCLRVFTACVTRIQKKQNLARHGAPTHMVSDNGVCVTVFIKVSLTHMWLQIGRR
jgi:hypothetical protein